jgi:Zinc-binding dehydrogenase
VLRFNGLRNYTRMSDRAPSEEIIPLLNDYADALVSTIRQHSGDVLKLIDDGLLAIFPDRGSSPRVRRHTRRSSGRASVARNPQRTPRPEGLPTTDMYLGLHLGVVFYGNIGSSAERVARVREVVGGFGADLVMDCAGHPSAGPEGIEMLRDGGTFVEMGQFTDAGAVETNWHRICAKDLNVIGSWAFTANDLPLGVDMLYRSRHRRPWLDMQTLYPFSETGVAAAIADAMAMRTVKSTIVPWPELAEA